MDCERMRANELLAANMIRQMLTVVTSVRANCIALWIRVGFDCYRVKERKTEWEREERGKKSRTGLIVLVNIHHDAIQIDIVSKQLRGISFHSKYIP